MPLYNNGFPVGYNANQLYNPQPSQYTQQVQPPQTHVTNYITWVEGENAAKAYMMTPNTVLPLWDSEKNVIYLKSTDEFGKPFPMKILEYTVKEVPQDTREVLPQPSTSSSPIYVTKEDFENYISDLKKELLDVIGGRNESTLSGTQKKRNDTKSDSNDAAV